MAVFAKCPIQNGTEFGTPGDEYNKSPWREGTPLLYRLIHKVRREPVVGIEDVKFTTMNMYEDKVFNKIRNNKSVNLQYVNKKIY